MNQPPPPVREHSSQIRHAEGCQEVVTAQVLVVRAQLSSPFGSDPWWYPENQSGVPAAWLLSLFLTTSDALLQHKRMTHEE